MNQAPVHLVEFLAYIAKGLLFVAKKSTITLSRRRNDSRKEI